MAHLEHPPRPRVTFRGDATPDESSTDAGLREPHWADLSALVSRAEANRAEAARLQAERAELCAEALELVAARVAQRDAERRESGRRTGEFGDTIPLREVLAELSAALRVSERTISTWLGDGAALVGTYRATLAALREGRIDERHASAIIDAGCALSPETRAEYERLILAIAKTETAPATRHFARLVAARLQPEIVAENQRRALADRRVRAFDLDDGLSRLQLDGPRAIIRGIFERATDMATALVADPDEPDAHDASAEPDDRTLDQRRADVVCDLLLTGAPTIGRDSGLGAIRATVQVTVPILTLAGLDDDPALFADESPIDAETARALAAHAPVWQRVLIHPITHEPLRLDTYRPSKRLRRLIGARDQHCRWPGCRRSAQRCDIDHTIAWEEGGQTCAGNLAALCRRHHTLKHASPWHVEQLGGGTLEFRSPTGRRYRNNAPTVTLAAAGRPRWARFFDAPRDPGDTPPF